MGTKSEQIFLLTKILTLYLMSMLPQITLQHFKVMASYLSEPKDLLQSYSLHLWTSCPLLEKKWKQMFSRTKQTLGQLRIIDWLVAGCLEGRSFVALMLLDISVKQATDSQTGVSILNKPTSNFLWSVTKFLLALLWYQ